MATLEGIIKTLAKHPLWVFGWSVFTLCIGNVVHHEYSFPEKAASFQRKKTELDRLSSEFHRAEEAAALWSKTLSELSVSAERYDESLTAAKLSPKNIRNTTIDTIRQLSDQRVKVSASLGTLNNLSFELNSLQALQAKLIQDLLAADAIEEKRIQFLTTMMRDIDTARQLVPSITANVEESRAVLETSNRRLMIDQALERARTEYNDALVEGQAQERMYKMESRAAVASWTYIGAFTGGLFGWLVGARKERAKKTSTP